MRVAIVVGNPKPESRTLTVARAVAKQVCSRFDGRISVEVDLAKFSSKMFSWPDEELAELSAAVAGSDVLVVASPTYKATYTGLLKAFLDRYPNNGLAGVTAIPMMTAGSPLHGMSIELGLRPLLVELGASVPTLGLFFLMSQMDMVDDVVEAWTSDHLRAGGLFSPTRSGADS
jgi:FMN reductase